MSSIKNAVIKSFPCVQTDSNSNKAESGHMLITVYLEMLDVKYSNTLKLRNLWFYS